MTSSVGKSTFGHSRAPDGTGPKPAGLPGAPEGVQPKPAEGAVHCPSVPEVKFCDQFVSPNCFRPCGLGKFAMANCPSSVERPLVYTADTMPVGSMATVLNWP